MEGFFFLFFFFFLPKSSSNAAIGIFFTPPRNRGGVIFLLQFVCVCVCVCVCLSVRLWTKCRSNRYSDFDAVLLQSLEPYWNWWPWVKGQGHSDVIPIVLHNFLLTSLLCISTILCLIKLKFGMLLRYTLGRFVFKFHKNRMGDDVIVTSFDFYPNNCPYLNFYWTYKLRTWNQYTTT